MEDIKVDVTARSETFCYFDMHTECELGLTTPDSKLCAKCVADSYNNIIRS